MPKSYNSAGKSTRGMAEGRRSQLVSMGLIGIAVIVAFTCSCPTAPVWESAGSGFWLWWWRCAWSRTSLITMHAGKKRLSAELTAARTIFYPDFY